MNIVRENIGNLNECLTVNLVKTDYQDAVEKSLKDLRKKANIPGFRQGHVPMGMIERQYKSSVLLDVISKLINENLDTYLRENDINVLFEPMALPEKTQGDFEHGEDFSFSFEIGIRPEIKIDYTKAAGVDYMKVVASQEQVDEEVKKLRRRMGKFSSTEQVVDEDMVLVKVTTGEEGKEPFTTSITTNYLKEEYRKEFIGKKVHDEMDLDTTQVFLTDYERSTFLKCKLDELENAAKEVKIEIQAVHHMEPAEMDARFFETAFPNGDVKDEAAMRERLKQQLEQNYASQEKMQYRGQAMQALMDGMNIELPDDFVKRYMMERDSANYTKDNMDEKYPDLQKSLCFQLVESAIAADGNVRIEKEDVIDYINNYLSYNYLGMTFSNLTEDQKKQIQSMAASMLQQENTVNNVYENIYFERVTDVLREKAGAAIREVSWEEFMGAASEAPKAKKPRAKKTAAPKEEAKPKKSTAKKSADK